MSYLARALREPLLQFLILGAAVFAFYELTLPEGRNPAPRERIVVSEGRVQQLTEVFARTWQRPPTDEELRGLVEGYVKEEVHYREALRLGLDRDDTVIRRRMQQKLEFLIEPPAEELQPDDGALEGFLAENRERFREDPHFAFQQIFIRGNQTGAAAAERAAALLDKLRGGFGVASIVSGDPTLLPTDMPLSPLRLIERTFGEDFAAALLRLPAERWSGPIASSYGLHLVRVTGMTEGYDPTLKDVRDLVLQEWQHQKRQAYAEQAYRRLLDRYEVILPEGSTNDDLAATDVAR
jgi:hypothetical protein